jgi:uncharacterized protein (DUF1499 family)
MSDERAEVDRLLKCSAKPNCVCSLYEDDADHFIAPIDTPPASQQESMVLLKAAIQEMGGTIKTDNSTYISATFTSSIFKFVDDLELLHQPAENRWHIRSASRVGYSDFGVNRRRVEQLRTLVAEQASKR